MVVEIEGVALHLAHPDEIPVRKDLARVRARWKLQTTSLSRLGLECDNNDGALV